MTIESGVPLWSWWWWRRCRWGWRCRGWSRWRWSWTTLRTTRSTNGWAEGLKGLMFRVVQLNLTPEVEVFYMLFERDFQPCLKITQDHPVVPAPPSPQRYSWSPRDRFRTSWCASERRRSSAFCERTTETWRSASRAWSCTGWSLFLTPEIEVFYMLF